MSDFAIPVDLRNPGQVFACLGFMEATEAMLQTPCEGKFEYSGSETSTIFTLSADSARNPIEATIDFFTAATISAIAPCGSKLTTVSWGVETHAAHATVFPAPAPNSPATLPALFECDGVRLILDHWIDGTHSGRDNVKFWAGAGGYPGAALARDASELVKGLTVSEREEAMTDPFSIAKPMSSSFRLDWRRDYVPIDAGFSPNKTAVTMIGYPITELVAAIGLQNARPDRPEPRNKLKYRYGVSSARLPTTFVRAIVGAVSLGFPMRTFQMLLGWPGQEGQARCIIDAREEDAHDSR